MFPKPWCNELYRMWHSRNGRAQDVLSPPTFIHSDLSGISRSLSGTSWEVVNAYIQGTSAQENGFHLIFKEAFSYYHKIPSEFNFLIKI